MNPWLLLAILLPLLPLPFLGVIYLDRRDARRQETPRDDR